jgi:hypothetical protein
VAGMSRRRLGDALDRFVATAAPGSYYVQRRRFRRPRWQPVDESRIAQLAVAGETIIVVPERRKP